jgi:hypothetical protein
MLRFYRLLLWVQGVYTLLTATWGLVEIDSFMAVTGPKTDIWLVKTVSAILAATGITFLSFAREKKPLITACILGLTLALALAAIDFYYTAKEVIRWVYAADGAVELLFSICWALILAKWKNVKDFNSV